MGEPDPYLVTLLGEAEAVAKRAQESARDARPGSTINVPTVLPQPAVQAATRPAPTPGPPLAATLPPPPVQPLKSGMSLGGRIFLVFIILLAIAGVFLLLARCAHAQQMIGESGDVQGIADARRLPGRPSPAAPRPARQWLCRGITSQHAVSIDLLPPLHRDPFDRLLLAQALAEGLTLVTADAQLARYPGPLRRV